MSKGLDSGGEIARGSSIKEVVLLVASPLRRTSTEAVNNTLYYIILLYTIRRRGAVKTWRYYRFDPSSSLCKCSFFHSFGR